MSGTIWETLVSHYPYPGSCDVSPVAGLFGLLQEVHDAPVGFHAPPPLIGIVLHLLHRPQLAKITGEPLHCAAFDDRLEWVIQAGTLDVVDNIEEIEPDEEPEDEFGIDRTSHGIPRRYLSTRGVHPVHAAAMGGGRKVVAYFVDRAEHWVADHSCRTPMHFASMSLSPHAVEILDSLGTPPNEMPTLTTNGDSYLHLAARAGSIGPARHLLQCSEDATKDVLRGSRFGETAIHYAAESGNLELFDMLLAKTSWDQLKKLSTPTGATVAHSAARSSNVAMVLKVVEGFGGWDSIPQTGRHNGMLIKIAGRSPSTDVFDLVHQHMSNTPPPMGDDHWTPLHSAAAIGNRKMFRYLIEHYGCSPYAVDEDGYTVLHSSIVSDSPSFVEFVLSYMPEEIKQKRNNSHGSLLSMAVSRSNLPMIKFLVANGLGRFDEVHPTAPSLILNAARGASITVLQHLLDNGAGTLDDVDKYQHGVMKYAHNNVSGTMPRHIQRLLDERQARKVRDAAAFATAA